MSPEAIEDAFYRDLSFGTGGLRGTIGAGTNRMNTYVVAKASQGLANYLLSSCATAPSVVIGYDSRIKSDAFARTAAGVFAANGITVHLWPELSPVPSVSFATRYLHASAGVMITASHNPSRYNGYKGYNGYKVYGADGCQITTEVARAILAQIDALDLFADVKGTEFDAAVAGGKVEYIESSVLTAYVEEVKGQSVLFGDEVDRDVAIVYSPLNGTGLVPVTRVLQEAGFTNVTVVEEQRLPDGNFTTCPYPNPEVREAGATNVIVGVSQTVRHMLARQDSLRDVINNVWLFVPLGAALYERGSRRWIIPIVVSIIVECAQLVTGRGAFDMADIVCNGLGGLTGYWLLSGLTLASVKKQRYKNDNMVVRDRLSVGIINPYFRRIMSRDVNIMMW